MSADKITINARVKIIRSAEWPATETSREFLGQVGRVIDRDGAVYLVTLDGGGRYWAFASEMEAVAGPETNASIIDAAGGQT